MYFLFSILYSYFIKISSITSGFSYRFIKHCYQLSLKQYLLTATVTFCYVLLLIPIKNVTIFFYCYLSLYLLLADFPHICVQLSYYFLPCSHNILYTKIFCCYIYILDYYVFQILLMYFFSLGSKLTYICIWSLDVSAVTISTSFLFASFLNNHPMYCFIFPYISCLLNFGANTI